MSVQLMSFRRPTSFRYRKSTGYQLDRHGRPKDIFWIFQTTPSLCLHGHVTSIRHQLDIHKRPKNGNTPVPTGLKKKYLFNII